MMHSASYIMSAINSKHSLNKSYTLKLLYHSFTPVTFQPLSDLENKGQAYSRVCAHSWSLHHPLITCVSGCGAGGVVISSGAIRQTLCH